MPNSYFYSNIASPTTLSGNINNSVTTATVAATTGWPGSTPYVVAFDYGTANEELCKVTSNASGTLTIVRGFGGTSAVAHSTGAVVRHVVNAQDLTDFRSHEAAASAVHGVAGALVGATDVQTLTNKTLTSPTVNSGVYASGGSMAGTFTGTPTFSGAVVLSGTPNISNGAALAGTFTGTPTFSGAVALSGGGSLAGTFTGSPTYSGNAVFNAEIQHFNLYRGNRANATDSQWETRVGADSFARFFVRADGRHAWGPGSSTFDTNLYRNGVSQLQTDGDLIVGGELRVTDTAWTSFTPSWTISGSPATNTNVGWYKKLGKIVFFEIYTVWSASGTGTTSIQGNLPTTPFRDGNGVATTRQFVSGFLSNTATLSPGMVMGQVLAGGAGTALTVHTYDDTIIQSQYIQNGTIMTIQGWYREA